VPRGCAHGFLTLRDDSEVCYWMSARHAPEASRGLRFDDPKLGIRWPAPPALISERDLTLPAYDDSLLYQEPA
jgi:dTDP-4-dehydrorhamnose 3,5-epimerase